MGIVSPLAKKIEFPSAFWPPMKRHLPPWEYSCEGGLSTGEAEGPHGLLVVVFDVRANSSWSPVSMATARAQLLHRFLLVSQPRLCNKVVIYNNVSIDWHKTSALCVYRRS